MPSLANPSAIPKPIPLVDPVTTAALPLSMSPAPRWMLLS
jgi:hypothetical protein